MGTTITKRHTTPPLQTSQQAVFNINNQGKTQLTMAAAADA
jgi:hypothetical protein